MTRIVVEEVNFAYMLLLSKSMRFTFLFSLMVSKLVLSWQSVWKMATSQNEWSDAPYRM